MPRRKFLLAVMCFLLWPAATFVENQLLAVVSPIVWWLAVQSGATTASRPVFATNHYLALASLIGFGLGLIPARSLYELAASSFAVFRRKQAQPETTDIDWSRPLLWAWTFPTAAFLLRFTIWDMSQGQSVLGSLHGVRPSALQHFFGTSAFAMSSNWLPWFYDRLFLTAPMLFLLAYPVAVWLRHHLPQHARPEPELCDSIPTDTLGS